MISKIKIGVVVMMSVITPIFALSTLEIFEENKDATDSPSFKLTSTPSSMKTEEFKSNSFVMFVGTSDVVDVLKSNRGIEDGFQENENPSVVKGTTGGGGGCLIK